jgi:hypothetical protein
MSSLVAHRVGEDEHATRVTFPERQFIVGTGGSRAASHLPQLNRKVFKSETFNSAPASQILGSSLSRCEKESLQGPPHADLFADDNFPHSMYPEIGAFQGKDMGVFDRRIG